MMSWTCGRSSLIRVTARLLTLAGVLLSPLLTPTAFAEGTRTLHPATGPGSTGHRGVLDLATNLSGGVARQTQFLYVYAQAGEVILLGSRNRSNGGNIYIYSPQSFGNKGAETVPGTAAFTCSSQNNRGTIANRTQELAGPNSANGAATVPNGFNPCWYVAPTSGVYGVRFTAATSGNQTNTASIATPFVSTTLVSAWDVTVRSDVASITDINGRVFTYAWAIYLGGNNRFLENQLYYVSSDGYRYRQTFRQLDPNRAVFYANSKGFIDDGQPLYHDLRGSNQDVNSGPSFNAQITAQRPEYPIFFSDVSPTGPNATEVNRVLTALSIPHEPLPPILTNPSFVGNIGGNTSTVNAGGLFTFDTVNTLTYEIVISLDGVDFDPANPANRVLTGVALTGSHSILWDGTDNSGLPFPPGSYPFRIVGRNGEIHFPMIDVEGNLIGGPTLTQLNGASPGNSTVYFDDRGYRAANGSLIGELNGHLCGATSPIQPPSPTHSLVGVDSNNSNLAGTGKYYRWWTGSSDGNSDCRNNANEFFGTAKALDLWALQKSDSYELPIVIVPPSATVDVGTLASVTPVVQAGDSAFGTFVFTNAGSGTASGVTYSATLGNSATPATCPTAVAFTMVPAGVTATYHPAPACNITFAGMPTSLATGETLTFKFNYVVLASNPGPIPLATQIAATNETPGAPAPNTANAQTVVARPIVSVTKTSGPAAGAEVEIGDIIIYTLSANIANAPLTSVLSLADSPGTGLTFGAVTSSSPAFTCSGALTCTLPAGTEPGTYSVTYSMTVNGSAGSSVANQVTATGGGGENPPTCDPCSVSHPIPAPQLDIAKSGPASATIGVPFDYTITVTNNGNGDATADATVVDVVPAGLTINSVTMPGCSVAGQTVTCTAAQADLIIDGSVTFTINVTPTAAAIPGVTNAATVGGGGDPSCPVATPCSSPPVDTVIDWTASLDLVKTVVSTEPYTSGSLISYGLVATNTGTVPLTDVSISDPLLGTLMCTPAQPATLAPLASLTCSGTYVVNPADVESGEVINTAVASGTDPADDPVGATDGTTTPIAQNPAITLVKSVTSTGPYGVGDVIDYSFQVTNSGDVALIDITVNDPLLGGAMTCTPTGLVPGGSATCGPASYTVTEADVIAGSVHNQAVATGKRPGDPATVTDEDEVTTPVVQPGISVSKSSNPASGGAVAAGDTITYTLTAEVTDVALVSDLVLTDTLSGSQTFGTVTSAGDFTADTSGAPTLTFTLPAGTVPGSYAVSYTATVDDDATGTVGNTVTATGGTPPGGTPPTCGSCSTTHPLMDPAVTFEKSADPATGTAVDAGDTISYTLTVNVANSATLSDVVLTDTLGDGLSVIPGSLPAACSVAGQVITCTLASGATPDGSPYTFTYQATVDADATVSVGNEVTAAGGGDPDDPDAPEPGCASPGACETSHPLNDPVVTYAKTADPADGSVVAAGDTITYTLTVDVAGSATLSDVVLTDTLGSGLSLVAASLPAACDVAGQVITCTLASGATPADSPHTFSYQATVDADATVSVGNDVTATGGGDPDDPDAPEPACASPGACETTHPLEANVGVAKALTAEDGGRAGIAEPGETLTYTITLTNTGGVDATGIGVTDPLDPNVVFVSASNGGSHAAGVVTWSGLTVPADDSLDITVVVEVMDPVPPGVTQIANLAYLTGTTPPLCPPGGVQCVVIPTEADISVTKAVSGESSVADGIAEPGEEITYTLTVRNDGGTATTGTLVNEVVPEHTRFVSGSPAWSCPPDAAAGTACDALVDVPAHDGNAPGLVTLTFTVRVDDPLPDGVTHVANVVAVNDGTPPDCDALPTAPACAVMPTVNLRMTKTVASVATTGPSTFLVTYQVEVVNLGGSETTYTLTDTLGFPAGVVYTGDALVSTTGGTVNPALPGGAFTPVNGTVVQISGSNTVLALGANHTYQVRVPVGIQPGALQDAACDGTPGHGFYNEAHLTGSFDIDSAACAPIDGDVALIHLVKEVTLAQDDNGNRYGDVGDVLGYTFTISNPGTLPLTTVQLFDPRVQNLHCPAFTEGGHPFTVLFGDELFGSGFEFRVGGGTLLPGDSVVCSASYVLTASDVASRRVVNTATATGTGPAGQTVSSVATAIFTQFR